MTEFLLHYNRRVYYLMVRHCCLLNAEDRFAVQPVFSFSPSLRLWTGCDRFCAWRDNDLRHIRVVHLWRIIHGDAHPVSGCSRRRAPPPAPSIKATLSGVDRRWWMTVSRWMDGWPGTATVRLSPSDLSTPASPTRDRLLPPFPIRISAVDGALSRRRF